MFETVTDYLKDKEVEFQENHNMALLTTIKMGGRAKLVVTPKSVFELTSFVEFLRTEGVNYKIIGRMSNVLPTDTDYNGVLIKTQGIRGLEIKGCELRAYCGESLPKLAYFCSKASLSGFEEISGIPGSVGGSVCGNAGAYGRTLSDLLVSCFVYSVNDNKTYTLTNKELAFSYRKSILKTEELILLYADFFLCYGEFETINRRMGAYREKRILSQPGEPSLGSIFKRHGEVAVSKLIDDIGLKGMRIGGAEFSRKHAGFIVNRGGGCCEDVKQLVRIAEEKLVEMYAIKPEREIEYLE